MPAGLDASPVDPVIRHIRTDLVFRARMVNATHEMIVAGKSDIPGNRRRCPVYRLWSGSRKWGRPGPRSEFCRSTCPWSRVSRRNVVYVARYVKLTSRRCRVLPWPEPARPGCLSLSGAGTDPGAQAQLGLIALPSSGWIARERPRSLTEVAELACPAGKSKLSRAVKTPSK